MKKWLLIVGAALSIGTVAAQSRSYIPNFVCSYYGEPINTNITGFASSADAKNVIANIIDIVGLQPTFEIRSANIPNAAAVVQGGKRYILYNPNFITAIERAAGTKWVSIGILAHEIGHHLNGHTIQGTGSRPDLELEADEFSGFVLRKMGASMADAQLAMKIAADQRTSATHPGKESRLVSIANGWNKADAQLTGHPYVAQQLPRPEVQPQTAAVTSGSGLTHRAIRYDVYFTADRTNRYYITTQNQLVKLHGGQLSQVAQLQTTGRSNYPYRLYAAANDYFLVDRQGRIVTQQGVLVGYLQAHTIGR